MKKKQRKIFVESYENAPDLEGFLELCCQQEYNKSLAYIILFRLISFFLPPAPSKIYSCFF